MVSGPSYLYLKNDLSSIFEYENTSITAILICLDAFNFKLLLNTCMIPNIVSEKKIIYYEEHIYEEHVSEYLPHWLTGVFTSGKSDPKRTKFYSY